MTAGAVLVTGVTGFLGTWVVRELLTATGCDVVALARGRDGRDARQRLAMFWDEWPELTSALHTGRVHVMEGDIRDRLLGLDDDAYRSLAQDVGAVVHCAAEVGIHAAWDHLRDTNVGGAANVARFAAAAARREGGAHLVHVSTAYVAGARTGKVLESDLTDAYGFNSLYERSKYEAEVAVRAIAEEAGGTLRLSILRPAQIVGDSQDGQITTFNTLYYPLKLYLRGGLRMLPVRSGMRTSMVPVDYVAKAAVAALAAHAPSGACRTYHLVAPAQRQPTVAELVGEVRSWARANLGVDLPRPLFVPVPGAARLGRGRNLRESAAPKKKSLLTNMLALAPYFDERRTYDTTAARGLMGAEVPDWREYLPHLLEYAVRAGFLNHTGRTVFEQMLVRMRSASAPIAYYDVAEDRAARVDGPVVADDAERAARALVRLGVRRGDRVAYVCANSSRYLVLDAAIGLVGAASVPIYYTSPVAEVMQLVRESSAKLLFVGTKRLADALEAQPCGVPFIDMLRDAAPDGDAAAGAEHAHIGQTGVPGSWAAFLAMGDGPLDASRGERIEPVGLDDVATIRYTSGTTGKPKGVTFTQRQLAWMGRTMPALLDWRTRNATLRYLSFLPNSHVVEGILIAYAPYYVLSPIELYYLADFSHLARTLPQVRPTVFFSVPRFYEKVWATFAASGPGRYYLGLPDGTWKRLVAKVVRGPLLRKAGIGSVRQLVVGSAPSSEEMLGRFRSLGIEVHNAYGVTEAPLVSLNRRGANDLGDVGELLPRTQARIDGLGQIWVRGPQVSAVYDGVGPAVDEEGWFATGDLGHCPTEGRLAIDGRMKELIVTSYGKNVGPAKVEARLKGIAGIGEAMLVGDGKPYCAAVLWLDDDIVTESDSQGSTAKNPDGTPFDFNALDAAVLACNELLSHPEQVKRWVVLRDRPTISGGELTPNLKLRRDRAAARWAGAVGALYAAEVPEAAGLDGALHVGAADIDGGAGRPHEGAAGRGGRR